MKRAPEIPDAPPGFSAGQLADLAEQGLQPLVIEELQAMVVRFKRLGMRRALPKADVRDELLHVIKAVRKAREAIEALLNADPAIAPNRHAARRLLAGGGHPKMQDGIVLNAAAVELAASAEVLDEAMARLPSGAVRHRTASAFLVECVHEALQFGAIRSHSDPQAQRFRPSTSPSSPFWKITSVCLDAIGPPAPTNPERAIKAYVRRWRALAGHDAPPGDGTEPPATS